jgi:hypothetical protein
MNPCFSPLSYRAQPGAAAVHNRFLGGLLKHRAVRALDGVFGLRLAGTRVALRKAGYETSLATPSKIALDSK